MMLSLSRRFVYALILVVIIFNLWIYLERSSLVPTPRYSTLPEDGVPKFDTARLREWEGGTPKPPASAYSRTLVVGRLKSEDVSWIEQELPDISHAIYTVDDKFGPGPHTPTNKGREAMVYLTYIIDHYDNLSDTTLFFHAEKETWHNNLLLDNDTPTIIRHLSDDRVARLGYMNTRCHLEPGCPSWIHLDRPAVDYDLYAKPEEPIFTKAVFRGLFPYERAPPVLSQPCCAQFAVSRDRIRLNKLSDYVNWRRWLLHTPLDDGDSGRVFEYLWQYIFTRNAELCPRPHSCYCDGFGICFGSALEYDKWMEKYKERENAGFAWEEWDERQNAANAGRGSG